MLAGAPDGLRASPNRLRAQGIDINLDGVKRTARELLAHRGIDLAVLSRLWPEMARIRPEIGRQLEIESGYAGYIDRQEADIRAFRRDEALELPDGLDFDSIPGLSIEIREKLIQARPATLGAAARISGVTPAALTVLLGHVRRRDDRLPA